MVLEITENFISNASPDHFTFIKLNRTKIYISVISS